MTKRRSQNAVSLFPFLAVLVCTMGALILLLLVTTRRIRQKQEESATIVMKDENIGDSVVGTITPEQLAEAESRLEAAKRHHERASNRLRQMQDQRDLLIEERDNMQDELTKLHAALNRRKTRDEANAAELHNQQQHLRACQTACDAAHDDVEKARKAVREAESKLADAEGAALHTEMLVAQQLSAIETLRKQRQLNQERVADAGTAETLIEFSGPRGTARTPIIVDVDANGFLFPASGIRVRRQDLAGFSAHDNPLLAAILTTHRHRSKDSLVTRPYVLLLVRPEGILDFYPAQRVLNDSRIHFGYELLSEDEQIAVPEPADGETQAVRMAVLDTLSRRNQHLAGVSDLRQRIAALRAREAVRQQRAQANTPPLQGPSPHESRSDWAETPVVRPFPGSKSSGDSEEPNAVASNDPRELQEPREERAASVPPRSEPLQERRSIQQLLNPGLDIERSLAAAVEARRRAEAAGTGQYQESRRQRLNGGRRPDGTSNDDLAQHLPEFNAREPTASYDTSARQQIRDAIEQHVHNPEAIDSGNPASSGSGSQLIPQDNLPPLEGRPYRSVDTAQQPGYSASGQSHGDQPGNVAGSAVSQSADLALTYYEPVTVYLDPQYFTVAGEATVPLHGAPISSILEALLTDIDKATKKGPDLSFVRRLPVVKFVVSPGAHALYLQVAEGLHGRGIPASSVVSMESHVEEHSTEVGAALRSLAPHAEQSSNTKPVSEYQELP